MKWYLPQLRFSPLKSSQVTLLVLWLVHSATSCQPSVALPVFSASTLHVPLSVAAIAFAPDGEKFKLSVLEISHHRVLSVHYMLPNCFRYCMTIEIYIILNQKYRVPATYSIPTIKFKLLRSKFTVTISSLYNCMYPLMYISWPVQEWIVMADEQNTSGQYI